jgi:predicted MFS family arabinose efflux permease
MVNASRLVGPSLAVIVIAVAGEGYCFLIDGISYIAVIASLLLMHVSRTPSKTRDESVLADLKEGWQYVAGFVPIRAILLLTTLISLVGMPYIILMPIFAGRILHGGPHTLGFLMSATGVGALTSALVLARRECVIGLGKIIPLTAGLFGVAPTCFAVSRWFWLLLPLMIVTGYGLMQQLAANTILQTIVDEDKRGRVMSFYATAFQGAAPFSSLIAGTVANRIGAPRALAFCGCLCAPGTAWFWRQLPQVRAAVRPIYRRLGIMPEVAVGVQTASALQSPPED